MKENETSGLSMENGSYRGVTRHRPDRLHISASITPVFARPRLLLDYNQKPRYLQILKKFSIHKCFVRKLLGATEDLCDGFNDLRRADEKGLAASRTASPLSIYIATVLL